MLQTSHSYIERASDTGPHLQHLHNTGTATQPCVRHHGFDMNYLQLLHKASLCRVVPGIIGDNAMYLIILHHKKVNPKRRPQSRRRPRARSLAGGLRLVTGRFYARRPCRRPFCWTPGIPPPDLRLNPVDRFTVYVISNFFCARCEKHRFLQCFVAFGGHDFRLTGRRWCRLCVPRGQA